jgi:hypothetical protein
MRSAHSTVRAVDTTRILLKTLKELIHERSDL